MKNVLIKKFITLSYLVIACLAMCSQVVNAINLKNEVADENSINSGRALITELQNKKWIHGSVDCKDNQDPSIEVFQYDSSSYILRQNKCLSYEAPFIYVLIGDNKTVVVDTGATEDEKQFPLFKTIKSLHDKHVVKDGANERELLVIHTHSHGDHYAADSQFLNQANVTVITANNKGVDEFFGFNESPEKQVRLDLGGRHLLIMATPGHQEEAITIYDSQTQWLLTGDSFYPGIVYVKDWQDYRTSIARLASFVKEHTISAILGAHIEMTNKAGQYYDIGTIYQPNESPLPLFAKHLLALDSKLNEADNPKKISMKSLIIEPLGALPKLIGKIAKWFM